MASIKLKHSSGNSTILNSPAANPSSDITLKLPSTTGSAGQVLSVASANHSSTNAELEFAAVSSGGITVAQQFRITSNYNSNNNTFDFYANWEKTDGTAQGGFGSFADPSSGIFTFPQTGYYYVSFNSFFEDSGSSPSAIIYIHSSTDGGSNYSTIASTNFGTQYDNTGYNYAGGSVNSIVDVTDVAQVKVKFGAYSNGTVTWDSSSTENRTYATFIRLGDT